MLASRDKLERRALGPWRCARFRTTRMGDGALAAVAVSRPHSRDQRLHIDEASLVPVVHAPVMRLN